jgi:hypothetical protein
MQTLVDLRRLRAERRLFETHGVLAAARDDVAVLAGHLAVARAAAQAARRRALLAETPRAQREWEAARDRAEAATAAFKAAHARLDELESVLDDAFGGLLQPLP